MHEWVPPLRQLSEQAAEAYAFFNNNNQTTESRRRRRCASCASCSRTRTFQRHVVLAVIHSHDAGPELFAEVLAEDGHELVVWDIRTQGPPPQDFDAVMVFGGDQNVGEEVAHPWLHE